MAKKQNKKEYLKTYKEKNRKWINDYQSFWAWKRRTGERLWQIKKHNEAITRLLRSIKRPIKLKELDAKKEAKEG